MKKVNGFSGKKRGGLAGRLTRHFIFLAILLLLVTTPFLIYISFRAQRDALRKAQRATAEKVALTTPRFIEELAHDLQRYTTMLQGRDRTEQQVILTDLLKNYSAVGELAVFDRAGERLAVADRYWVTVSALGSNYKRAQTEQFTALQGRAYIGQVYIGVASGSDKNEPFVVISVPLKDEEGAITGILVANVNLSYIWTIVAENRVGEEGYVYILDSEGNLIAHPDPYLVLQQVSLDDFPTVQAALAGAEGIVQKEYEGLSRRQVVGTFIPVEGLGWWVVTESPASEAYASIREMLWLSGGLLLLGLGLAFVIGRYLSAQIVRPIQELREGADIVGGGNLNHVIRVQTGDEIGVLAQTFNAMAAQLRELVGSLEQRVADRTRRLEIVASLGERLSAILDLEELLAEVVNQIKDDFGYYHAHIYLLDDKREKLVVTAGTGEAGAEMKAKGYSIFLNAPTSLVARAARAGEIVRVDNVREAKDWLPNPLLPDTYSEMAVPILLEGQVAGVLDVQEDRIAGLDEGDAGLLRSLANQVAVAIRNAHLFERVETALAEARAAQEQYVQQAWEKAGTVEQSAEYQHQRPGALPLDRGVTARLEQEAMRQSRPVVVEVNGGDVEHGSDATLTGAEFSDEEDKRLEDKSKIQNPKSKIQTALVSPIKVQDQTIGAIQLLEMEQQHQWNEQELALVQAVADQVAQAAENLRLLEETRERAGRERAIREITDKLRAAPNVDALLETAARELGQRLGVRHTVLELGIEAEGTGDL